jgi:archaellum component FlaG (FlaF/FlaG flagellin family)
MAKPKIKNMMLIENTQIINNPNQISKSKLIPSNRSIYLKRLKRGRPKV